MTEPRTKVVIDNSSVAGAGRALYEAEPDPLDIAGLEHLLLSLLLSDEVVLDGSSRRIGIQAHHKLPEPFRTVAAKGIDATWTWHLAFPALTKLGPITDMYVKNEYRAIDAIAPYLLRYFSRAEQSEYLFSKVPSIYRSSAHFDWYAFEQAEVRIRNADPGFQASDAAFACALYAWRGLYYFEFAKEQGLTYLPSPERTAFIEPIAIPGARLVNLSTVDIARIADLLSEPRIELLESSFASDQTLEFVLPPVVNLLVGEAKTSRSEVIDRFVELRLSKEGEALRRWFARYLRAYRSGDFVTLGSLTGEFRDSVERALSEWGAAGAPQGGTCIKPKLPFQGVRVPKTLKGEASKLLAGIFENKSFDMLISQIVRRSVDATQWHEKFVQLSPIADAPDRVTWVVKDDSPLVALAEQQSRSRMKTESKVDQSAWYRTGRPWTPAGGGPAHPAETQESQCAEDAEGSAGNFRYDVFISYSHLDSDWVNGELLRRLEDAGLKVCIDHRDFEIGTASLVNMERAVDSSRHTLLVLSPHFVNSEWTDFEALLVGTKDPAGRRRKVFPLLLEPCNVPPRIAMLTHADFVNPAERDGTFLRLIGQLRGSRAAKEVRNV